MRCSVVISTDEAFKVEERKEAEERIIEKVFRRLLEADPKLLMKVLEETGAKKEIQELKREAT